MNDRKGTLVVLSGPAGSGKSTVLRRLLESRDDFCFSVSLTTRSPRPNEVDGVDYFFTDRSSFEERIRRGELLEYTEYVGNYYGTPREYVKAKTENGINVVLDIEVEGAMQVRKADPSAVLVFITPPDFKTLESRLKGRGTESPEVIMKRLERAKDEIEASSKYDYIITNYDGMEYEAALDLTYIVRANALKTTNKDIRRSFYL